MKQVSYQNLKTFADQLKLKYATKDALGALQQQVDGLVTAGGEPNVLTGVKVNGTALSIAEKMVDILVATGTTNGTIKVNGVDVSVAGLAALAFKAEISQTDLDTALAAVISGKADAANVYSKEQIDGIISSVYKPAGSVAFADLPAASAENLGKVYNVTNKFTTTDAFVEGAGKSHPAGTNVAVVSTGEDAYAYDVLAGFVDLSEHAKIEAVIAKVTGATAGNFPALTADGTLVDSGKKPTDFVAAEAGKRLITDDEATKLDGIATGATKVEASETNGKVKVNGAEVTVYTLPSDVLHSSDIETITEAEIIALLADTEDAE